MLKEETKKINDRIKFYRNFIKCEADWIKSLQISSAEPGYEKAIGSLPDAATGPLSTRIIPYFTEIAIMALLDTKDPSYFKTIKGYIDWHFNNLNLGETDNITDIPGTLNDFEISSVFISNGRHAIEYISKNDYDSSDAYAALLFSILRMYYDLTGDKDYLVENFENINSVLNGLFFTMSEEHHLTWAKINHKTAYMMDNGEVHEGLGNAIKVYSILEEELVGNEKELAQFNLKRVSNSYTEIKKAIEKYIWSENDQYYFPSMGAEEFNWSTFYADATCQVLAITTGVTADYPGRSEALWEKFNKHYSSDDSSYRWEKINIPGALIWGSMPYAAALVGDYDRVDVYMDAYAMKFQLPEKKHGYPLYSGDAGQVLRAACVMLDYYLRMQNEMTSKE